MQVLAYNLDTLSRLLAEQGGRSETYIRSKSHTEYFRCYFEHLGAKTIVVESEYVDRDYLEDYAAYYSRCHYEYPRKCTRLHFFSEGFSEQQWLGFLSDDNGPLTQEVLQKHYLGFIVLKPLPETVIGCTCLRVYDDTPERSFPILREYHAHLWGVFLKVRSLAFQEQDHVVAACATSALWAALQGTGTLFQHGIPSPIEITRSAARHMPGRSRILPNKEGLTIEQMAHAIRDVGLEPLAIGVENEFTLKTSLYAYLKARIPVLLIGRLCVIPGAGPARGDSTQADTVRVAEGGGNGSAESENGGQAAEYGSHSVVITGYRLGSEDLAINLVTPYACQACNINKIYAHDDAVGPFARMRFDGTVVSGPPDEGDLFSLSTSYHPGDFQGEMRFVPKTLLVPLYHKIRIPFDTIREVVTDFQIVVSAAVTTGRVDAENLLWDVYLTTVNDYKQEVRRNNRLSAGARIEILRRSLPRFLWRAKATCRDGVLIDLLLDATDIEQGYCFVRPMQVDPRLADFLASFTNRCESQWGDRPSWTIVRQFKSGGVPPMPSGDDYVI